MPTVFRKNGWRFFFYSMENDEPPHVHVRKGDAEGKVWLDSLEFAYKYQYSNADRRFVIETVRENAEALLEAWHEHFET